MNYTAAVITVSDKGFRGEREDRSGPALSAMLEKDGWDILHRSIVPDETERIQRELCYCTDVLGAALVLTTGGTGFSPRDITPEATRAVTERETPGLPELMRAESMKLTPRGCLSRGIAGIRRRSLIVNLPGSERAAREHLTAGVIPLRHGIEMLRSSGSADCAETASEAVIRAVCVSEEKGIQKHPVEEIQLVPDYGIPGDAHAGNWHRQVSILGADSVAAMQEKTAVPLQAGVFAENILAEGIRFSGLPVGTRLMIGSAVCEVTQIGKECHSDCAIRRTAGDCVMPREGVFVKVLRYGKAKAGDKIRIV